MIPPNDMERARLAFWNEDGNLDMKLNAAFRSLSAAWPEADGRLREALSLFERCASKLATPEYALGYREAFEHARAALAAFPEERT